MAWCNRTHRSNPIFRTLPFSEEFFGLQKRWYCAGCAYNQGYDDGAVGRPSNPNLAILDQSQASEVRHKNPLTAYDWGYADAIAGIPRRSV